MNLMKYVPAAVTVRVASTALKARIHSPQILFGVGVVGVVATAVLAAQATLKVEDILQEHETKKKMAGDLRDAKIDRYTETDYKTDLTYLHVKTAMRLVKVYSPAILVGVGSIACLTWSHYILTQRNMALTAAYAAVDRAFKEYRQRVVSELGEDKDREFRYGWEDREIIEEDPKGAHKVKTVRAVADGQPSMYARFFDEASPLWEPNAELNLLAIKCQQNYANDRLRAKGHVFLNEVYDSLGIPRSKAGAIVGWAISKNGDHGDNYIDFGVFDPSNERARDFVNGRERSILLDFNVDGVILDQLDDISR